MLILQRPLKIPLYLTKNFDFTILFWSIISQKISGKVSVLAHRYIFKCCICIGTDTFCKKVSVSAHRYILNVSTKGLIVHILRRWWIFSIKIFRRHFSVTKKAGLFSFIHMTCMQLLKNSLLESKDNKIHFWHHFLTGVKKCIQNHFH